MNPPPPMLPAAGCVTAMANATSRRVDGVAPSPGPGPASTAGGEATTSAVAADKPWINSTAAAGAAAGRRPSQCRDNAPGATQRSGNTTHQGRSARPQPAETRFRDMSRRRDVITMVAMRRPSRRRSLTPTSTWATTAGDATRSRRWLKRSIRRGRSVAGAFKARAWRQALFDTICDRRSPIARPTISAITSKRNVAALGPVEDAGSGGHSTIHAGVKMRSRNRRQPCVPDVVAADAATAGCEADDGANQPMIHVRAGPSHQPSNAGSQPGRSPDRCKERRVAQAV